MILAWILAAIAFFAEIFRNQILLNENKMLKAENNRLKNDIAFYTDNFPKPKSFVCLKDGKKCDVVCYLCKNINKQA